MDKILKLIKEREKKDWYILGGVVLIMLVMVGYASKGRDAEKPVVPEKNVTFSSGTQHGDLKSYFTNHVKKELKEQSEQANSTTKMFKDELKDKDKRLEELESSNIKLASMVQDLISKIDGVKNNNNEQLAQGDYDEFQAGFRPDIIQPVGQKHIINGGYNNANLIGYDEIELVTAKLEDNTPKFKDIKTYLPAGTHIKGIIVGGVDAHTEVYGENNTRVVTIRLVDGGTIPNGFTGDMKNCTLLASAWGNASSERVAMRGERLTCVSKSGKILETKILATVYGSDGRQDVRGRVVYPEGKLLQRAFLAGSLSGIGGGIAQSMTSQSISPLGATSVIPNQDVFKYGAAQGVGKGLDKLADYYIKRAEQLQPIIQVGSGAKVDIVIQQGFYLDGHNYQEQSGKNPSSPFESTNNTSDADDEANYVMSNIKETM